MQENVALDLVANQETKPASRVEPFHTAGHRRHFCLGSLSRRLNGGPCLSLGQLDGRAYHLPPLTLVLVSANRLYATRPARSAISPRSTIVPLGQAMITLAKVKEWPARTIAAIAFSRRLGSSPSLGPN